MSEARRFFSALLVSIGILAIAFSIALPLPFDVYFAIMGVECSAIGILIR